MWDPVNWRHWRVIIKLDPNKILTQESLSAVLDCNPEAIVLGGTQGINKENTMWLLDVLCRAGYTGTVVQEISDPSVVIEGVDAYFIPVVLNSPHYQWITGFHHEAIKKYQDSIDWNKVLTEGYVICNTVSMAGIVTGAMPVDAENAVAYSILAEKLLGIPVIYIEYSGVFGDPSLVEAVAGKSENIHVIYGGGITRPGQAQRMLKWADTIVIGNVVYENPECLRPIFNKVFQ